ncbi:MAG: nuclear transport factor 2 family protein [Pseudomonadota bacterium]
MLRDLEEQLHCPKVRKNPDRVAELLHPDFFEIGRSGKHFDRQSIVGALRAEKSTGEICSADYEAQEVAPGMVLLMYRSWVETEQGDKDREALRTSLWVRTEAGWLLRFHQGTPTV